MTGDGDSGGVTYPQRVGSWRFAETSQESDRPGGHYELDTVDERVLVSIQCPHFPSVAIDEWPVTVHDLGENRLTLGYFSTEAEAVAGAVEYMSGNVPSWAGSQPELADGQQTLVTDGGQSASGTERNYMTTFAHHSCREKDRETLAVDDSNGKLRCAECGRFCKVATGTEQEGSR